MLLAAFLNFCQLPLEEMVTLKKYHTLFIEYFLWYFSALPDPQALMNAWACACDTNGDFAISFEESQSTECANLQVMLMGQNVDQATFEKYDLDNNNVLDINDVLNWGNLMSGGAAGFDRSKFDILPFYEMNLTFVINLAFQFCLTLH